LYPLLRPLLFQFDPERIHGWTLAALRLAAWARPLHRWLARSFDVRDPRLEVEAFGLRFRNPVGLAAGYDKNGAALPGLAMLGFGHLEIGTLTRQAQPGNPRPRVHRFAQAQAIVNSMGFPNLGIGALPPPPAGLTAAQDGPPPRLFSFGSRPEGLVLEPARRRPPLRIGVNLGKGRDTPLDQAAEDYVALLREAHTRRLGDYLAINVSSPNTTSLRQLQGRGPLEALLGEVARARDALIPRLPVLVKIAPDLTTGEIDSVLEAVTTTGLDGVIATNTTTRRVGVPQAESLPGGLSGGPLRDLATAAIRHIARQTGGRLPIVGVGGILRPEDALEKLDAGAVLVQLYTGLVYTGPGLVREINRAILRARDRSR
jgi:dihydroorotate dehydrogenase